MYVVTAYCPYCLPVVTTPSSQAPTQMKYMIWSTHPVRDIWLPLIDQKPMSPSVFPCILELQDRNNVRVQFFQNFTQKEEKDSFEHDNWLWPMCHFCVLPARLVQNIWHEDLLSVVMRDKLHQLFFVRTDCCQKQLNSPISWTASMNRVLCIGPEMLNRPLLYNFEHKDI